MKNVFKSVLKSKKKIKTASALVITGAIIFGANAATDMAHSEYSNQNEVVELASELGVDTSAFIQQYGRITRMQHNGDQPIFVSFSDNISAEAKEEIVKALDYFFGIIGDINPNYRYQIVEDVDDLKYFNKTTIEFEIKDINKTNKNIKGKYYGIPNSTWILGSKGNLAQNMNIY